MQSPRSLETPSSERRQASAAAAAFRARLEQASQGLLTRIRFYLSAARMDQAGDLGEQARDILQDVVVEALRSEHAYDTNRDLLLWLHGIAANVVRRRVERFGQVRRRLVPEPLDDPEAIEALEARLFQAGSRLQSSPDEALAARQEVESVLADLPEQHAEVLRLYYLEHNMKNDAVAAALDISPVAARVRRCRALEAARKGSTR